MAAYSTGEKSQRRNEPGGAAPSKESSKEQKNKSSYLPEGKGLEASGPQKQIKLSSRRR
jgi:hypothetical protein